MHDFSILQLAQAGPPQLANSVFLLILGIIAVCAIIGVVWFAMARRKMAAADAAFIAVGDLPGVRTVRGADLAALSDQLTDLFRQMNMSMYARHQNLLGAYRYETDGLTVTIAHVVLGLERSNANHQTLDKVLVLVDGLPETLPTFLLTPNNYIMRKIHKTPVFPPTNRFGVRNMVRGRDADAIRTVFTDEARQLLMDNRNTVVQSRGGALAFYLHDETVIPPDIEGFLRDALAFAGIAREQAVHLAPENAEMAGSR